MNHWRNPCRKQSIEDFLKKSLEKFLKESLGNFLKESQEDFVKEKRSILSSNLCRSFKKNFEEVSKKIVGVFNKGIS